MKGYEMILLVNGVIFLVIGLLTLLNGLALEQRGVECPIANATHCERQIAIGTATRYVAPALFAVSILLFGTGAALILRRRWSGPPPERPDEGPGYP